MFYILSLTHNIKVCLFREDIYSHEITSTHDFVVIYHEQSITLIEAWRIENIGKIDNKMIIILIAHKRYSNDKERSL